MVLQEHRLEYFQYHSGGSFASIAVFTKVCTREAIDVHKTDLCLVMQEGLAQCSINEDGECQIACAASFSARTW